MKDTFINRIANVKTAKGLGNVISEANTAVLEGNMPAADIADVLEAARMKGEELKAQEPEVVEGEVIEDEEEKPRKKHKGSKIPKINVTVTDWEKEIGDKVMKVSTGVGMAATVAPVGIIRGIFGGAKYLYTTKLGSKMDD